MSEQPQVVCVMLTADRHALAAKATEYFRAQTYQSKKLLVFDTGREPMVEHIADRVGIRYVYCPAIPGRSNIGLLRNLANADCEGDIIVHWDSDDYSAPTRIAEQVAFLQASGADAVGYSEMLFWDTRGEPEAWLFRTGHPGIALGTSLAYWTRTWQRVPFPATLTGRGEDSEWLQRVKCAMQSGVRGKGLLPRMIARIHSGNTSNPAYDREEMARNAKLPGVLRQWERAPQFDQICREVLGV